VTAVAASPVSSFLAGKVHRRAEAVRKHIFELENDWPEDKDQYPFIVYALYKRRKELLEHELEWLTWLENLLKSTEGDILNLTWDQATQ